MVQNNKVTSNLQEKPKKKKRPRADKSKEAEGDGERGDETRKQFVSADYALICDWLEVPKNLDAITGTKGKTKVGTRFRTKKQAFETLATFVNERQLKGSKLATVDGDGARNRYILLERKYKAAKPIIEATGFGLTEEDLANHIDTMDAKIESLCPCYHRLDELFGSDPNVNFSENNYNSTVPGAEVDHMPWSEGSEDNLQIPDPEEVGVEGLGPVNVLDSPPPGLGPVNVLDSPPPVPSTEMPASIEENAPDAEPVGDEVPPVEDGAGRSTHSGVEERIGSASSAQKKQKASKKPDKGASVTNAFAAGLEAISQTKVQSNVLKERGQDLVFKALEADRQIRPDSSQKQLDFQIESTQKQLEFQMQSADRQYQVEVEKLKVAEKRIVADELKIVADSRRDLMTAQVSILNSNPNLSAAEIANLFRMLANPDQIG